jgi:hypothetical protein
MTKRLSWIINAELRQARQVFDSGRVPIDWITAGSAPGMFASGVSSIDGVRRMNDTRDGDRLVE